VASDPLVWWANHKKEFPELATLAQQFLSPPPSNASSESVFSIAANISCKERSKLLPENIEKLLFLRCNLRAVDFIIPE